MSVIRLKAPRGERPKIHPTLLNETEAQIARNIRLEKGTWRALRVPSYVSDLSTLTTVISLFRYTASSWFEWDADVNAVRSMLPDDPWDRVYYTGDGAPKFTVNSIATAGGVEIATDGGFDIAGDITPWTSYVNAVITWDAGQMKVAHATGPQEAGVSRTYTVVSGVTYDISMDVSRLPVEAGYTINLQAWGAGFLGQDSTYADGTLSFSVVANSTTLELRLFDNAIDAGSAIWADNLSVLAPGGAFPANSYDLGIPAPSTAPGVAVSGTPTDATDPVETTYYTCTYIDAYGAEGANSPISAQVEWQPGQTVNLTSLPAAPAGAYNISLLRIYRTNTGTYGTVYQKVVDLAIGTATYDDSILSGNLSTTTLESTSWDMPNAAMKGLITMPGEFMVGFYGNVLAPSEAGQPHAYPAEYELKTDYDIVGIAAFGNTILVTTVGTPYIAQGVSPESLVLTKMEIAQACVSKRSVVDIGPGAVYASPDGLILMSGGGPVNITEDIFDRDDWQALNPTSMHACLWEGRYLVFYNTGAVQASFSIDPVRPQDGVIHYDRYVNATYTDLEEDAVYVAQDGTPQTISEWDSGTNETYKWKAKKFTLMRPMNFSAAQIRAETYPVTFVLTVDGVEQVNKSVTSAEPFRLPAGFRGVEYEPEIRGTNVAYEIVIAQHLQELRRV